MKRLIRLRTECQVVLFGLIGLCLRGLLGGEARAGTAYTWLGVGNSNDWTDTTGNWDVSPYPGYQALIQDDTAYFAPAPQRYNTLFWRVLLR